MYPNDLIPAADYIDKGEEISEGPFTIPDQTPYPTITLKYIPRGRTVNDLGVTIPSSISVRSVGGTVFSEVFDLQSLVSKTFYADPLNKTLYFSPEDKGFSLTVDYITRGDIIRASIINTIQNNLRQVECIRVGQIRLDINGTGTVDFSGVIPAGTSVSDMYVIATTSAQTVPGYVVDPQNKTVQFTGISGEYVNYIVYLVLSQ